MLLLLLLSLVLLVAFLYGPRFTENDTLVEHKREIQKYSGFQPGLFRESMNFMELFQRNLNNPEASAQYLYDAVNCAESMKMYVPPEHQDDLHEHIKKMAIEGEHLILERALSKGIFFRTSYLKDSYDF